MANFQTHVGTAAVLGVAYGAAGVMLWQLDWGVVLLAAGLTAMGGTLPDLDSDSGRPVRELSTLAAFMFPILLIPRLRRWGLSTEQGFCIIITVNFGIRYGMAALIRRVSVHRGMFHSLPALAISGLAIFLVYHSDDFFQRAYLAVGVMVGFLSHLVLDEIYAVNFSGLSISFNQFSGSAIKLFSSSWRANTVSYFLLILLGWLAWDTIRDHRFEVPTTMNERNVDRINTRNTVRQDDRNTYRQVIRPGGARSGS